MPECTNLLSMDFPILDLIDNESASDWLLNHFHPNGLTCPHCEESVAEVRCFRQTATSQLPVYRCLVCDGVGAINAKAGVLMPMIALRLSAPQVRLRVVHHADKATLAASMHQFTELDAIVYTE